MKMNKYTNSKTALDHYFGNHVGAMRVFAGMEILDSEDSNATNAQRDFVSNLRRLVNKIESGEIVPSDNVGIPQLNRIVVVAESGDWTKKNTIKRLYDVYSQITGESFDLRDLD